MIALLRKAMLPPTWAYQIHNLKPRLIILFLICSSIAAQIALRRGGQWTDE